MVQKKRVAYNFIFSAFSQLVTIAMGLIIPRITLVSYGSEVNGLLNSAAQFVIYLSLFESGIQAVASKALYKPVHDEDKTKINDILTAVNENYRKIGYAYFVSLLALAAGYSLFVKSATISFTTAFFVVLFSGLGNVILFFFQGKYRILLQVEGKTYLLANIQTTITILTSAAKIALLYFKFNVVFVVLSAFIINLIQAVYIMTYINKKYKWISTKSDTPNFECLKEKNYALVHQFSSLVFQNTDVLILTIFTDLKVVSVYSLYKLIVNQLTTLLQKAYESASFALGQFYNTDKEKYKRYIDAVEVYFCVIVFSVYSVTYYLLTPFITLYTKGITDISYVDKWLPILFVAVELLTLTRVPMLNTINYAGHFKNTLSRTITETAINLSVSIVAVLKLGIYGVLIGTVAALIYRTTDVVIYGNRRLLDRTPLWTFGVHALNILLFVGVQYIYTLIPMTVTSFSQFIVAGVIFLPCTVLVFLIINTLIYNKQAKLILSLRR